MAKSNPFTPSFNAGELTPRLAARTDFAKYANGLSTCENLIPLAEGGLLRRAATRYIAEEQSSSVKGRIRPFQFSTTQNYMLEFGNQIMRFYRHQGQIISGASAAVITNGDFPSGITSWDDRSTGGAGNQISHDATNLMLVLETSGTDTTDIGWAEQEVTNTAAVEHIIKFRVVGAPSDKVGLQVGTATLGTQILTEKLFEVGYHCYAFTATAANFFVQFRNHGDFRDKDVKVDDISLVGSLAAAEIDTPYLEAELFQVNGPQSADTLYLYHPSHPTHKLLRLGHTSWSLSEVAWEDGPYLAQNDTVTTLNPSATTGMGITLTLSVVTGVNDDRGWLSTDIGRSVRYEANAGSIIGYAVITAITSTTIAVADVRVALITADASVKFRLGAWSGTTGYPSVGAFYEQRQFAGNNTKEPQKLWATQTADFENHTPDDRAAAEIVADDDALDYTISADEVNAIRWMSPGEDTLVIGTTGGEWIPITSTSSAVLTPSDITVRRQTTHGSKNVQPVRVGAIVLFVQAAGRKIREFGYAFETDGFQAVDMTRLAYHLTVGGINEMAYAEEPDSLVWCVRNDGQLLSMTFRREEDVVGWARHIIGGSFSTGNAVVESVAVIGGADGSGQTQSSLDRDEVWVTVKRTINSVTKRYIEVLERDFEDGDDADDAYYADSIITYDGASATVLSGLDHLEGETVKVNSNGATSPDLTVASGSITVAEAVTTAQIGLSYTHKMTTLKFEGGTKLGTAVGKIKQVFGFSVALLNSMTMSFGKDSSSLRSVDFREVADVMDSDTGYFTGEKFYEFDDDWETDARMTIQSSDPVSFTLLALAPEIDTREGRG